MCQKILQQKLFETQTINGPFKLMCQGRFAQSDQSHTTYLFIAHAEIEHLSLFKKQGGHHFVFTEVFER